MAGQLPHSRDVACSHAAALVAAALSFATVSPAFAQDPTRASNLSGVVARNTVTLSWQAPAVAPSGVLGYQLDIGLSSGATAVSVPLGNVLTFSASAPDGVFFIRVQALTSAGPTGPSNEIRLVTGSRASR